MVAGEVTHGPGQDAHGPGQDAHGWRRRRSPRFPEKMPTVPEQKPTVARKHQGYPSTGPLDGPTWVSTDSAARCGRANSPRFERSGKKAHGIDRPNREGNPRSREESPCSPSYVPGRKPTVDAALVGRGRWAFPGTKPTVPGRKPPVISQAGNKTHGSCLPYPAGGCNDRRLCDTHVGVRR